ncbi:MAG: GNAT family N-acetyltransferase [Phycisphaerae bacterium]|jgi:ribosomal-protein-alanine N-acetyltransferase|nr:GNAT family N-acetyltransferase [Phycisphaerae bacterium]
MNGLRIRHQQVSDAKRFYEILNHPDFIYFPAKPKSIEQERQFLRTNKKMRQDNVCHNYSVLLHDEVVGTIGIKISPHYPKSCEVGYFVDRAFWGKGIASAALKLVEEVCFNELRMHRIELFTLKQNKASIRVAEKCAYRKEGIQRHKVKHQGKWADVYMYSKIEDDHKQ